MMAEHNENPGSEDTDVLDPSVIDRVPWDRKSAPAIRHVSEEFVTGCPFENDSDFPGLGVDVGELTIVYEPGDYLLETNTFQEYLNQFKDARLGHEAIVDEIYTTVVEVLYPDLEWAAEELDVDAHVVGSEHTFVELTYPVTTSGMRRDVAIGNRDLLDQLEE